MKKLLVLSLLLVFCFCLPALAADEKQIGEDATMIFKYKANDNTKVGDSVVILTVYDKENGKKIISDNYIYQGLTSEGAHIKVDTRGTAWNPTRDTYLKVDQDGFANLVINYMKGKSITFKLKPTDKKVLIFAIQE